MRGGGAEGRDVDDEKLGQRSRPHVTSALVKSGPACLVKMAERWEEPARASSLAAASVSRVTEPEVRGQTRVFHSKTKTCSHSEKF